jgi:Uma2 family endonuclease
MLEYQLPRYLPSAEELPDSDETPVDNELQELIPGLLKAILLILWSERMDWLFGIDMGIYHNPDQPPIVPDGFLSLGVDRFYDEELRPSYVLWDENVVPIFALEIVSQTYRKEYTKKKDEYADLGVLYYIVYSSRRRRKPRLEIYKLLDGEYILLSENPVWMPEIGLGIGCERGKYSGVTREWLYWYNEQGERYPTPEEWIKQETQQAIEAKQAAKQAQQAAKQAQQTATQAQQAATQAQQAAMQSEAKAERLAAKLRELNIDPDGI